MASNKNSFLLFTFMFYRNIYLWATPRLPGAETGWKSYPSSINQSIESIWIITSSVNHVLNQVWILSITFNKTNIHDHYYLILLSCHFFLKLKYHLNSTYSCTWARSNLISTSIMIFFEFLLWIFRFQGFDTIIWDTLG